MNDIYSLFGKSLATRPDLHYEVFWHPDEVLGDPHLSIEEKRALLAFWASDANAVADVPAMRQLPDGSIIKVDDILRALQALDALDNATLDESHSPLWQGSLLRRGPALRKWPRKHRRPDDDDDPPPSPAYAARRPKGSGGGAFAIPEPVAA